MYNSTVLQLFSQPCNMGSLADADAVGQEGIPGEGPYMTIYLRLGASVLREARFETYGCPAAIACGSWLTQWAIGKPLVAVQQIEAKDLLLVLGGLPLGKEHCAHLAINALKSALQQIKIP